ncbi:MAG: hypothetical protein AB2693_21160 [Candidatus Thiodiazotropha sp.]
MSHRRLYDIILTAYACWGQKDDNSITNNINNVTFTQYHLKEKKVKGMMKFHSFLAMK